MPNRPVVMVVEDDVEMNDLQRELLDVNGLDSVPAYTGLQALKLYETCTADAMLLDVMLPEMDGFETCRRLRLRKNGNIPVVIITAMGTDDARRQGFEAGADAYFTKPFDPDEVIKTLRDLIGRKRRGAPGR